MFEINGTVYDIDPQLAELLVMQARSKNAGVTEEKLEALIKAVSKAVDKAESATKSETFGALTLKFQADPRFADLENAVNRSSDDFSYFRDELEKAKARLIESKAALLGLAKEIAATENLTDVRVILYEDDRHAAIGPANGNGNGHGGSAAGRVVETGAVKLIWVKDEILAKGTIIEGISKQDAGGKLWPLVEKAWKSVKPYQWEGKTYYNRFLDAVVDKGYAELQYVDEDKAQETA